MDVVVAVTVDEAASVLVELDPNRVIGPVKKIISSRKLDLEAE